MQCLRSVVNSYHVVVLAMHIFKFATDLKRCIFFQPTSLGLEG